MEFGDHLVKRFDNVGGFVMSDRWREHLAQVAGMDLSYALSKDIKIARHETGAPADEKPHGSHARKPEKADPASKPKNILVDLADRDHIEKL